MVAMDSWIDRERKQCGNLKGLHTSRHLPELRRVGGHHPYQPARHLHKCGTFNKKTPKFCNKCGDPVAMQLKYDVNECQERGIRIPRRSITIR